MMVATMGCGANGGFEILVLKYSMKLSQMPDEPKSGWFVTLPILQTCPVSKAWKQTVGISMLGNVEGALDKSRLPSPNKKNGLN